MKKSNALREQEYKRHWTKSIIGVLPVRSQRSALLASKKERKRICTEDCKDHKEMVSHRAFN